MKVDVASGFRDFLFSPLSGEMIQFGTHPLDKDFSGFDRSQEFEKLSFSELSLQPLPVLTSRRPTKIGLNPSKVE